MLKILKIILKLAVVVDAVRWIIDRLKRIGRSSPR